MERHDAMTVITTEINRLISSYTEGLIADFECIKSLEHVVAQGLSELVRCVHCGHAISGPVAAILREGTHEHVPCCSECYAKYHAHYMCIWGIGYANPGTIDHNDLDRAGMQEKSAVFFVESNGYDLQKRTAILALKLGEAVTFNTDGSCHSVVRVK